jgi:hypothetical protein
MKFSIAKIVYNGLLTGLPNQLYNPFRKNNLLAEFKVLKDSAYFNYKLNKNQVDIINKKIKLTSELKLIPICIFHEDKEPEYYISVNMYVCESPLFEKMTRCEVNTYVKDKNGDCGTLILDYGSDTLSMDPVNIFKFPDTKRKTMIEENNKMFSSSKDFIFESIVKLVSNKKYTIHKSIHKLTDRIYYPNGIYDKMFYDVSFTEAIVKGVDTNSTAKLFYNDMQLDTPDSIFYFENDLNFVTSMWHNLRDFK